MWTTRTFTAALAFVLAPILAQAAGPPPRGDRDWYGDPLPHYAVARLGTVRLRHPGGAGKLAFSGDGKLIASSGAGVRLWRLSDGGLLHVAAGLEVVTRSRGRLIAMKQTGDGVTLHDVGAGKEVARTRWSLPTHCPITFSADTMLGVALSFSGDIGASLWDLNTGKKIGAVKGEFFSLSVALSPDGKTLLTGDIVGEGVGRIRFWDVATRKMIRDLPAGRGAAYALALSDDGKTLAVAHATPNYFDDADQTQTAVTLRDAVTGKELRVLSRYGLRTVSLAFSPDGKTVALGRAGTIDWAGTIELYDTQTGRKLDRPSGHPDRVVSAAFRPGGAIVTCGDSEVRTWDERGRPLAVTDLVLRAPLDLTIDPGGTRAAWVSNERRLFIRDLKTGKDQVLVDASKPLLKVLRFRQDGKVLAVFSHYVGVHGAALWDIAKAKHVRLEGYDDDHFAYDVAFSPDGARVVGCSYDSPFTFHDAATGKKLRSFEAPGKPTEFLAFTPNGKSLAASHADQTISLWDVATGKRQGVSIKHPAKVPELHAGVPIALSPDGTLLASGGVGGETTVRLWDLATGKELARLPGHMEGVRTLVFSPDGRRLISGSEDSTALVWDLASALAVSSR